MEHLLGALLADGARPPRRLTLALALALALSLTLALALTLSLSLSLCLTLALPLTLTLTLARRDLHDALGGEVPIGLISSNWGGTPVQAWQG